MKAASTQRETGCNQLGRFCPQSSSLHFHAPMYTTRSIHFHQSSLVTPTRVTAANTPPIQKQRHFCKDTSFNEHQVALTTTTTTTTTIGIIMATPLGIIYRGVHVIGILRPLVENRVGIGLARSTIRPLHRPPVTGRCSNTSSAIPIKPLCLREGMSIVLTNNKDSALKYKRTPSGQVKRQAVIL